MGSARNSPIAVAAVRKGGEESGSEAASESEPPRKKSSRSSVHARSGNRYENQPYP